MARPTLETSAKYKLLVRRLGIPRPFVRGLLETLWDVANTCGNPLIGSPAEVEAAAEWPGEDGEFFAALRDGRWIDETADGQWAIHDYYDHAPDYVQRRAEREAARRARGETIEDARRRAAHARWSKQKQTDASDSHVHANDATPAPAHIEKDSLRSSFCVEPLADARAFTQEPAVAALETLQCVGQGAKVFRVVEADIVNWSAAYPAVDVLAEIRKAKAWLEANPKRRKTSRGMKGFLNSWLSRAQDRPRPGGTVTTPSIARPVPVEDRPIWDREVQA